jgi:outer membrane immunogenic protein
MDARLSIKDTTAATTTALAAIAAASSGAAAADVSFSAKAPPPPVPTWEGLYLGASLGASWLNSVQDPSGISLRGSGGGGVGLIPVGTSGATSSTVNAAGWLGGFQLGYNWQHSNFVYGLESDFSWIGSNSASSNSNFAFGRYSANTSSSSRVNALATFRARFGLDFNGTMPYLTGGFAFGHMQNALSLTAYNGGNFNPATFSTAAVTQTSWVPGVVVGGGVEHQLARNWALRGEIMWVGFQTKQVANPYGFPSLGYAGAVNNGGLAKFSDTLTIAKVGLNYRF